MLDFLENFCGQSEQLYFLTIRIVLPPLFSHHRPLNRRCCEVTAVTAVIAKIGTLYHKYIGSKTLL